MDLSAVLNLINSIAMIMIFVSLALFSYRFFYIMFGFKKPKNFKETDKKGKYAILVPARDESSVIEGLLKSLKNQTYDKDFFDVYVITETEEDLTNILTKKYGYNFFVRQDLEDKHTKGFALDEVIKDIYNKNLHYDAFFIIDADNTIAPNYIEEMNKAYFSGIDIAMSYKNVTNINDDWVSCCSSLLFCNVNTFQNKAKTRLFNTMLISGTGFYISSKIIDEFKGFPFTSLTEDYELSSFITMNKYKVAYVESTEVFVEQPVELSTVNKQRIRWCKGYFDVSKKMNKETKKAFKQNGSNKIGILENRLALIPNVVAIATIILYTLSLIVMIIIGLCVKRMDVCETAAICLCEFLAIYYLVLCIYTMLQFIVERDRIKVGKKLMLKSIVLNPIFINLFVYQAIAALVSKNVGWKKIERTGEAIQKDNVEAETGERIEVNNG